MLDITLKLKESNKVIDKVVSRLEALKEFFIPSISEIVINNEGFTYSKGIEIISIYESTKVQVLKSIYHDKDVVFSKHTHNESIEYLIVVEGKIAINIEEITRIVSRGECASIPVGVSHSVIALANGTELWAICIPPEKAYLLGK